MNKSDALMLSSLSAYYKTRPEQREVLYNIVTGNSPVSLRVIDWFVTHYARINNIVYWMDDYSKPTMYEELPSSDEVHRNLRKFHLYLEYRAQLQSYTKMYFDPFRRYERITFVMETNPLVVIESTVGQLNFFRWALQNNVIEYIMLHLSDIEDAMSSFQSNASSSSSCNDKDKDKEKNQKLLHKSTEKPKKRIAACVPNIITHTQCFVRFD